MMAEEGIRVDSSYLSLQQGNADLVTGENVRVGHRFRCYCDSSTRNNIFWQAFLTLLSQFSTALESVERPLIGIPYDIGLLPALFGARKTIQLRLDGYLALAE